MSGLPIRVWAPNADRVELCLPAAREPMRRAEGGWWESRADVAFGTDYAFILDGGPPLPDPRSPWQPAGVHGPSRTYDHAAFAWTDDAWRGPPLGSSVLYELHVGTFTPGGTFDAAIERLPELRDLGVTHVEVMPVAAFDGERGWGYDGVDLFAPHHAYGGPDGMKRFVDAAHAHGLGVILDVVYNHLGPSGSYLDRFGPYFTARYVTPWGAAVNLDGPDSDEVRRFVIDNAVAWLRDYHLDGLRIDAIHALFDASALHVLEELADEVRRLEIALGRTLHVTVESDLNDPRLVRPVAVGGYGLDAAWADDVHHAIHALLTGERAGYYRDYGAMEHLADALEHGWVYRGRTSPDRGHRRGREPIGLEADHFIACIQNHDQVGNRARGDRFAQLVGLDRARIAAALILCGPWVPLLFQGEEWAASSPFEYFAAHGDPALAEAIREGRRAEFAAFGWDPEDLPDPEAEDTYRRSVLDWDERGREPHATMLAWYAALIELRRTTPALLDPRWSEVRCRWDEDAGWFVVERGGAVAVAFNLGPRQVVLDVPGAEILLASPTGVAVDDGALALPPDGVAVVLIGAGH